MCSNSSESSGPSKPLDATKTAESQQQTDDAHKPTEQPGQRVRFQAKDYVTLTISVVALALSAGSFYFQNLRVSNYLAVTTVAPVVGSETIQLEVAFFNLGNRPQLIDEVYAIVPPTDRERELAAPIGSIERPVGLPAVLKPGEILKVVVQTTFDTASLLEFGQATTPPFNKEDGWKVIPIGLHVLAFDSLGKRHDLDTEKMFSFGLNANGSISAPRDYGKVVSVY